MSAGYLDAILARKRLEVAERKRQRQASSFARRRTSAARSLFEALSPPGGPTRIVAEVKRASPSAGTINAEVDAPSLAGRYAVAGAAAISVLTDGPGFGGSLEDLVQVKQAVALPCLRKDFVVDGFQLLEALEAGADAALLIVAALTPPVLRELLAQCQELGLEALVEVHDARELDVAMSANARIIGINNRNLRTFEVELAVSEALLPRIPGEVRAVAESGVRTAADIRRLRGAGGANFLVGEALVRAAHVETSLQELLTAS